MRRIQREDLVGGAGPGEGLRRGALDPGWSKDQPCDQREAAEKVPEGVAVTAEGSDFVRLGGLE